MYWKLSEKRQRSNEPARLRLLEPGEVDQRRGRVLAATAGEERGGHHDLDRVAEGEELLRRLARAAAHVEDAQGAGGQEGEELGRVGRLRGAEVGGRDLEPVPEAVVEVLRPRQPLDEAEADVETDGLSIEGSCSCARISRRARKLAIGPSARLRGAGEFGQHLRS
jgi:hypothetical protein